MVIPPNKALSRVRSRSRALLLVLALICAIVPVVAVVPAAAVRYHIHTYTQGDGLPSGAVQDVAQSADGRMWFATRAGIVSYDGHRWDLHDPVSGLPTIDQYRVLVDGTGRVWAVGREARCAVYDGTGWTSIDAAPYRTGRPFNNHVAAVTTCDTVTTLWLGHPAGGLVRCQDGVWERMSLGPVDGLSVRDIHIAGGNMYLATSEGTWVMDPCNNPPSASRVAAASTRDTWALASEEDGSLWTVATRFIERVQDGAVVESVEIDFPFSFTFEYLAVDGDGTGGLFVANPHRLVHYHPMTGITRLSDESGFTSIGATSVLRDREGNVWLGTLRGISKVVSLTFVGYTAQDGLLEDEVTAVLERESGEVVLGHPNGFTFMSDDEPGETLPLEELFQGRVLDIAEDGDGTLWAAISAHGLASIGSGREIHFHRSSDGLDATATSVRVDNAGRIWATTYERVYVNEGDGFRWYEDGPTTDGALNYLRRIFKGYDGTMYVGANDGLYEFSTPTRRYYVREPGRANSVYAYLELPDGSRQVGTGAGLYAVTDSGLTRSFTPEIRAPVYFATLDGAGRSWFGTDDGVAVWDGSELERLRYEDGLVGRETNRAGGFLDSQGRVWVGMDRGVSVYRPWFDTGPRGNPVITLLGTDVDSEPITTNGPLTLRGSPHAITFHFRAVSFVDEKRTRVQVQLAGYDDWLSTRANEARYSHIPPGEYRFHVRAAGPSGEWATTETSVPITILAPMRETAAFRMLMGAAIILVAYAIFLFVANHRYARRLRREVDARVAELRTVEAELDRARRIDTIGVLAAGIAHDFNNLLAVIIGNLSLVRSDPTLDEETADGLEDSLAAGKRARALARQLLTFARGGSPVRRTGSMAGLLRESVSFLLSGSNVGAQVDLPEDMWAVEMDTDQMSQVVNNLLINAQQAMPAGGVISVGGRNHESTPHPTLPAGRYVEVFIRDAGTGIREEHIERIFDPYFSTRKGGTGLGLTTAYSIVSRHDGLLTVDSKLNVGTVFRVYLPASDRPVSPEMELDLDMYRGSGSILVMDDEDGVRTVLERILTRAGYEVVLTSEGAAAVEQYRQRLDAGRRFDIVIMDLTVPGGMGGREALDRLRAIDPGVRAIVASGYSTDPVMSNHRKFGFVARVSKPFSISTLLRAVARTIHDGPGAGRRDH